MKTFLNTLAVLLILAGGVWFLQGVNLLPGSFMTAHIEWAYYGGLAVVVGILLLLFTNRKKGTPPKE